MEDIERILAMIRRGMNSVLDLWPVKLIISALATLWTWLFGGTEAIFAAVLGFVVLDTLTKWAAITKRYLIDHGADPTRINIFSIITGWFCAWEPNYLESSRLRQCWGDKLLTYFTLIIAAGIVQKFPAMVLFGLPINSSICGGIYTFIATTELLSICGNFEEMGNQRLATLRKFLVGITNRLTGSSIGVTIQGSYQQMTGGNIRPPLNTEIPGTGQQPIQGVPPDNLK